jgi:hypothetical protein
MTGSLMVGWWKWASIPVRSSGRNRCPESTPERERGYLVSVLYVFFFAAFIVLNCAIGLALVAKFFLGSFRS